MAEIEGMVASVNKLNSAGGEISITGKDLQKMCDTSVGKWVLYPDYSLPAFGIVKAAWIKKNHLFIRVAVSNDTNIKNEMPFHIIPVARIPSMEIIDFNICYAPTDKSLAPFKYKKENDCMNIDFNKIHSGNSKQLSNAWCDFKECVYCQDGHCICGPELTFTGNFMPSNGRPIMVCKAAQKR